MGQLKYPTMHSAWASRGCSNVLSNTDVYEWRSPDKACILLKREAAPVALVTAVDCGSRGAGFGHRWLRRSEISLPLQRLQPSCCLLRWCRGSPEAPHPRMIATDIEQRWPQGGVKVQHRSDWSSICDQFRGAFERLPNLNRTDQ